MLRFKSYIGPKSRNEEDTTKNSVVHIFSQPVESSTLQHTYYYPGAAFINLLMPGL